MTWLETLLLVWSVDVINSRTFQRFFTFHVLNENTSGKLIEVQERSFEFGSNGSVSVRLSCNDATEQIWGNNTTFNIFLCNESPKTRWLFLYPDWGMCFDNLHPYHHCTVDKLTRESGNTWTYNRFIAQSQNLVARIRICPVYRGNPDQKKGFPYRRASFVAKRYHCEYSGVFINGDSRLSLDEKWNPFVYGMLTVVYGGMALKAVYEIVRFWKFRVNCCFYVYTLVFTKFCFVTSTFLFYQKILTADNLFDGYTDQAFVMALAQAGKFTAYYLTLLAISSGYCIYNTRLPVNNKVQLGMGMTLYTLYFYIFVLEDSYIEVPLVVILSAAYAAVLSLFWAYHFRRLLLIRYEFHALPDRHQHTRAKIQISRKEILVGVSFAEIIFFLAYILVFEFYRADNYPVPGLTGVLATECLEFLLILPLTLLFNMRDLTRFYPVPAPPPIIHVVKTPDDGYKISMKEAGAAADEVSVNEATSEIQLVRLPSAHTTASFHEEGNAVQI
jgi:hypothetical protein